MSNHNLIAGAFYCVQSKIASYGTQWPIIQITVRLAQRTA